MATPSWYPHLRSLAMPRPASTAPGMLSASSVPHGTAVMALMMPTRSRSSAPKNAVKYSKKTAICSVWGCEGFVHRPESMGRSLSDGAGCQLATRGVDLGAACAANGHVHATGLELVAKRPHAGRRRSPGEEAGRGVEGDEVDVGAEGAGHGGQLGGVGRAVVGGVDQGPLERQ